MPTKAPNIKNIDLAVRLYYEKFELGTADIRAIFDAKSSATVTRLKKMVREEMAKSGRLAWNPYSVPTDIAFSTWGLDINDLERRRKNLIKLGAIKEDTEDV